MIFSENIKMFYFIPLDTGHKLNIQKAFRRRTGRILNNCDALRDLLLLVKLQAEAA